MKIVLAKVNGIFHQFSGLLISAGIIIGLIALIKPIAVAQVDSTALSSISRAVEGIQSTISYIGSEAFYPMSHYSEGEWIVSCVPIYVVSTPYLFDRRNSSRHKEESYISGEDFKGMGVGISSAYAFTNRWLLFGTYTVVNMSGRTRGSITGTKNGTSMQNFYLDGNITANNFQLGVAFDAIKGTKWSLPIFLGGTCDVYSIDMRYSPLPDTTLYPYMDINADNVITTGIIVGAAASRNFSLFGVNFRITPFLLWLIPFKEITYDATVTRPNPYTGDYGQFSEGETYEGETYQGSHPVAKGIKLIWISDGNWTVSLSLNGILGNFNNRYVNYWNGTFDNGLQMRSIFLAFTYTGGRPSSNDTLNNRSDI